MGAAAEDAAVEAPAAPPATNGNGDMTNSTPVPSGGGGGASSRYLVVFHAVSAGLNGAALGSDEQEIVFIVAVVLDVRDNQVRGEEEEEPSFEVLLKMSAIFPLGKAVAIGDVHVGRPRNSLSYGAIEPLSRYLTSQFCLPYGMFLLGCLILSFYCTAVYCSKLGSFTSFTGTKQ